ncbi:MAG: hypothetical protein NWR22_01945, partial [Saprospiraceae bacterium]|nr:hypothetical protein [Saprospiraceae bacterium]
MGKETVLVIPDLHAPYQHNNALDFLKKMADYYQPTKIVCLGDELDQHGLSFFEKETGLYSAGHEYDAGMEFMQKLYKEFPIVSACISNHTHRPWRIAKKAGLPSVYLKDYHAVMQAPLTWVWKYRHIIDNVCYEHGDPCSGMNG